MISLPEPTSKDSKPPHPWTERDRRLSEMVDHARAQLEAAVDANDPEMADIFAHLLDELETIAFADRVAA